MVKLNDLISFRRETFIITEIVREGMPLYAVVKNPYREAEILTTFPSAASCSAWLDNHIRKMGGDPSKL